MKITFKYIIVRTGAILFNELTTHAVVAEGFEEVYSAGFAMLDDKGITCTGGSESLKIKGTPELDRLIINDFFNTMSSIKYFAFNVDQYYKENGVQPLILKQKQIGTKVAFITGSEDTFKRIIQAERLNPEMYTFVNRIDHVRARLFTHYVFVDSFVPVRNFDSIIEYIESKGATKISKEQLKDLMK